MMITLSDLNILLLSFQNMVTNKIAEEIYAFVLHFYLGFLHLSTAAVLQWYFKIHMILNISLSVSYSACFYCLIYCIRK